MERDLRENKNVQEFIRGFAEVVPFGFMRNKMLLYTKNHNIDSEEFRNLILEVAMSNEILIPLELIEIFKEEDYKNRYCFYLLLWNAILNKQKIKESLNKSLEEGLIHELDL